MFGDLFAPSLALTLQSCTLSKYKILVKNEENTMTHVYSPLCYF